MFGIRTLQVDKTRLDELQAILDQTDFYPGVDKDGIIEVFTANFGEGYEADIKVCNGDGPYVDPVLFHDGCEVAMGEPDWSITGSWEFEAHGYTFTVSIVPKVE